MSNTKLETLAAKNLQGKYSNQTAVFNKTGANKKCLPVREGIYFYMHLFS